MAQSTHRPAVTHSQCSLGGANSIFVVDALLTAESSAA
jgi:hypothetical protein